MGQIRQLDQRTIEHIAAGEVIGNPACVVKELIENALDAGAQRIDLAIEGGGLRLVRVSDDGQGMESDDALLAFAPHATSKLREFSDLAGLKTLGFRGEALASIARVGQVTLRTRRARDVAGTEVQADASGCRAAPVGCPSGTTVEVRHLFYNTPARRKALDASRTEVARISAVVTAYALAWPQVAWRLSHQGRTLLSKPPGTVADALLQVYGTEVTNRLLEVRGSGVAGAMTRPEVTRADRSHLYLTINGRVVRHPRLIEAVLQAYAGLLPQGRFPVAVLHLTVSPQELDVNIHPRKEEVALATEAAVCAQVTAAVSAALNQAQLIRAPQLSFKAPLQQAGPQELVTSRLPPLRLIGQFRQLYLLCESIGRLIIIDQHAAHERVVFEQLWEQFGTTVDTLALPQPEFLALTPSEQATVLERSELTHSLGLEFQLAPGGITLSHIPAVVGRLGDQEAIRQLIAGVAQGTGSLDEVKQHILGDLACHPAFRAGETLSSPEATALILALDQTQTPWTCPHGRPTLIALEEIELARHFGRPHQRFMS